MFKKFVSLCLITVAISGCHELSMEARKSKSRYKRKTQVACYAGNKLILSSSKVSYTMFSNSRYVFNDVEKDQFVETDLKCIFITKNVKEAK